MASNEDEHVAKKAKLEDMIGPQPQSEMIGPQLEESSSSTYSIESIKKYLANVSQDRLIDWVIEIAAVNPDLYETISELIDADPVRRKLFVYSLMMDVTEDQLTSFFAQYGDVEKSMIVVDKATGRSKGYGFVLFRTSAAADKALLEKEKNLGGRLIHCRMAAEKSKGEIETRKLFVRNVSPSSTQQSLAAFFTQYGSVSDVILPLDPMGKLRGYAFITFSEKEGAQKALMEPAKMVDNNRVICKLASEGPVKPKDPIAAQLQYAFPGYPALMQGGAVPSAAANQYAQYYGYPQFAAYQTPTKSK